MKLVYFTMFFPKLSETFIFNQVRWLFKKGVDVKVVPWQINRNILNTTYCQYAKECPWGSIIYDLSPSNNPHKLHAFKLKLDKLMVDADCVQFEFLDEIWGHVLPLIEKDVPKIVETWGYDISRNLNMRKKNLRSILSQFDAVIAKCGEAEIRIEDIKGPSSRPKVYYLDQGIDLDHFGSKTYCRLRKNHPLTITSVGRIVEKKGFTFLIKAMAIVARSHPKTILQIIGDGPLLPILKQQVKNLKLSKNVVFKGEKTQKELIHILRKTDIFAFTPVIARNGDIDTTPLVLKEAQAMYIPVVSSWLTGIPEVVKHGFSGILAQPKDVPGIARALNLLIDRPDLRIKMGTCGRKKMEKEFDIKNNINLYIDMYKKVIHDHVSL